MLDVFREVARRTEQGETVAMATVIRTRGSTPRRPGARMAVMADGHIVGTVGGGCGEAEVWRVALEVLRTGVPQVVKLDLTADTAARSGAICGGTMEVLVVPVGPRVPA